MINRNFKSNIIIILTLLSLFSYFNTSEGISTSDNILSDNITDTIFYNGKIVTMDESRPLVEAILIKNGSINAIGNEASILASGDENTTYYNLQGKTLVPGFIDAHSHWIGDRGLTNTTDFNDVMNTLVSSGWTSISELFVNEYRLNELQSSDQADLLKVRVNAYLPLSYDFQRFGDWYQAYQPGYEYSDKLRIAGVKLFADGWYKNPILYYNQSEINSFFQETHNLGYQIAIHSVVTNATDMVLEAFQSILGNVSSTNPQRHRIEHLVLLRDDQITKMADLNLLGCIQLPWFNSDWTVDDVAEEIRPYTARWRELYDAGVHLMGSTDYPYTYEVETPIQCLSIAVTRAGIDGNPILDWMLNQTLTIEEALRLLTINAAYGTFQEDVKGSIEVGKLADVVVLSNNPLYAPETDIIDIKVLMTMIGGEIVFQNHTFETGLPNDTSSAPTNISFPIFTSYIALIVLVYFKSRRKVI